MVTADPSNYTDLGSGTGNWATWSDVDIYNCIYDSCDTYQSLGSMGTGDASSPNPKIGPEVGIGLKLKKAITQQVMVLKIAWGGIDLAIDLRPPSSGMNYNGTQGDSVLNKYNDASSDYSVYYDKIVTRVQDTLVNIATIVPDYDTLYPGGYNIAGTFFFQGWNDLVNYDKVFEYEYNMKNFMSDIRVSLNTPNMPFVIGEIGMHGTDLVALGLNSNQIERVEGMRTAQAEAANADPYAKLALTKHIMGDVPGTNYCPTIENLCSCSTQQYHYHNSAKFLYEIGLEMGKKMLELLGIPEATAIFI